MSEQVKKSFFKSGAFILILVWLAMGIGFTVGLTAIALVREVLGAGTITIFPDGGVITIPGLSEAPALVFAFPAGALIVVGFLQAFFRWLGEATSK